jgi:hypothetical protein
MDIYSVLLLHYLKQQRSESDIENLQTLAAERNLWSFEDTTLFDPDATAVAKKARVEREKAEAALSPINAEDLN